MNWEVKSEMKLQIVDGKIRKWINKQKHKYEGGKIKKWNLIIKKMEARWRSVGEKKEKEGIKEDRGDLGVELKKDK